MAQFHVYSQTVADGTATSVVRPSDWNSGHQHIVTLTGNTAGVSTISGTNVIYQAGNNVTVSGVQGASVGTIVFSAANQTVQTQASGNIAGAGFTSTTTAGTAVVGTHNSAGLSMGIPAFITTAAQSNHSHGNPTLALTNLTGTTASNSAGLTLSLSGNAAQTVQPVAVSGSNGSFAFSTLSFGNLNGLSFYTSNGSIVGSYTDAGGGGGGAINFSAGTTSGNLGTVVFSNSNNVSFGLNGGTITGSVPATSSLSGVNVTLSTNGNTISVIGAAAPNSFWPPIPQPIASSSMVSGTSGATGGSFQTTAALYISPMVLNNALTFGEVEIPVSHGAFSAGTGSGTIGHHVGIYTLNGGTALSLVSSFVFQANMSVNSATAVSGYYFWGTNSTSNSTSSGGNISASFTGARQIKVYDSTGYLSGGDYWVAHALTMRSSSVNVLVSFATGMYLSASQTQVPINYFGDNSSSPTMRFIGSATTTQNNANSLVFAMPTSIHTSAITNTGGTSQHRFNVVRMYV